MKKLIIAILFISLSGCAQIKNLLGTLDALNQEYCAENNATKRAMIIAAIRSKYPDYPDGGLCAIEDRIKGK